MNMNKFIQYSQRIKITTPLIGMYMGGFAGYAVSPHSYGYSTDKVYNRQRTILCICTMAALGGLLGLSWPLSTAYVGIKLNKHHKKRYDLQNEII